MRISHVIVPFLYCCLQEEIVQNMLDFIAYSKEWSWRTRLYSDDTFSQYIYALLKTITSVSKRLCDILLSSIMKNR
jgi:hypothetical protein